jgi:hypothetical protein
MGVRQLVTAADLIPVIKVAMSRTDEVFGTRSVVPGQSRVLKLHRSGQLVPCIGETTVNECSDLA